MCTALSGPSAHASNLLTGNVAFPESTGRRFDVLQTPTSESKWLSQRREYRNPHEKKDDKDHSIKAEVDTWRYRQDWRWYSLENQEIRYSVRPLLGKYTPEFNNW